MMIRNGNNLVNLAIEPVDSDANTEIQIVGFSDRTTTNWSGDETDIRALSKGPSLTDVLVRCPCPSDIGAGFLGFMDPDRTTVMVYLPDGYDVKDTVGKSLSAVFEGSKQYSLKQIEDLEKKLDNHRGGPLLLSAFISGAGLLGAAILYLFEGAGPANPEAAKIAQYVFGAIGVGGVPLAALLTWPAARRYKERLNLAHGLCYENEVKIQQLSQRILAFYKVASSEESSSDCIMAEVDPVLTEIDLVLSGRKKYSDANTDLRPLGTVTSTAKRVIAPYMSEGALDTGSEGEVCTRLDPQAIEVYGTLLDTMWSTTD